MGVFMRKAIILLLLTASLFAACVEDNVCTVDEYELGDCVDCALGHTNLACVDDDVCTSDEYGLGGCADCAPDMTGLYLLGGGIGFLGVLVLGGVIIFFAVSSGKIQLPGKRQRL